MSGNGKIPMIAVSVAYATAAEQYWRNVDVPAGSTIRHVIETSGVLSEFPNIDLEANKVGVFGHIATLDTVVKIRDRVEIYRPITINPQLLPKQKYRLRKVEPIVESRGRTVKIEDPIDRIQIGQEEDRMSFSGMLSEYGFVVKVDVTDIERSIAWYRDKFGFKLDERFSAGSWRQMTLDGLPHTALGLFVNPDGAGLGGKKVTFVVEDIEEVRNRLLRAGVEVDEIEMLGDWVKLAFLRDPDGNVFGIRQNMEAGSAS
jgi:putative ubiquitin-RnfH superfamily antitoxin RatB of RatAB toxin-antitoxin module/catechol 2,3-dioxygenase-like lactoylglutathione lyase family enzyme